MAIKPSNLSYFLACVIMFIASKNLSAQEINETTLSKVLELLILENKLSNPDSAKSYVNILLEKCKKNDDHYRFLSFYQLGDIAKIQGHYNDAISYINSAILISEKFKDKIYLFEVLLTKGNTYLHLGNNKEVLSNYLEAATITKKSKDIRLTIRVSENIAKIKERIGQHENALRTYRNSLKLTRKIKNNSVLVINTLMGKGRIYLNLNKPDSSLHYSKMGLIRISKEKNNLEVVSYFYNDIGKDYFKKGLFHEAITYLKKSEQLIIQLDNKTRLVETCYFIGFSYYKLIDLENTIKSLKNVEQIVDIQRGSLKSNFNPPELLLTYKLMSKAYKAQNKNHEASIYTKKYIVLDDYNDLSRNKIVIDLFEIKEKELQSALILAFNEKNKVCYLLLFISLISLLFAFKFAKEKKQYKIAFQKLLKKTENVKPKKKAHQLIIKDEKAIAILQGLDKLEQAHYFLNTECSLSSMAKKLKTNTAYLSKIIHEYKQKNFYQYLNGLRIQYVLQRLKKDRMFRNYSIEYISQEIGYKSTNSFTKHFKAHTKLYPSYYIKTLWKYEENSTSN